MSTAKATVKAAKAKLDKLMAEQKAKGVPRYAMANILFSKDFTEHEVGTIFGVHPKTAHAFKINLTKSGIEARKRTGKRLHLDPKAFKLKRIGDKKVTAEYVSLAKAVLEKA